MLSVWNYREDLLGSNHKSNKISTSATRKKNKNYHLLQIYSTYPPCFFLHLVHALLGQVEVGLQMTSHHGKPEYTHQYDDPQPQSVVRLFGHPNNNGKEGDRDGMEKEEGTFVFFYWSANRTSFVRYLNGSSKTHKKCAQC